MLSWERFSSGTEMASFAVSNFADDKGYDDLDSMDTPTVDIQELSSDHDGFPPQKRAEVINENGIVTVIVTCVYSDHFFVSISQDKRFGTLIKAWQARGSDRTATSNFETNVLLGQREDTVAMLYARKICERLSVHSDRPLLLAINLCEAGRDLETMKTVLSALFESSA